jgi:PEP-CTERM motif
MEYLRTFGGFLMKRLGQHLVAILPTLLFAGVASGSTLVVNCSTVSGPTELVSAAIACGQFNIGGATLANISIAVSGGITGTITLTNGDSSPRSGTGTTTSSFNFAPLNGFSFVNPVFPASFTTGLQPLAAGQTLTVSGLSGSSNGTLNSNNSVFGDYTGGGFFDIFVSTDTIFSSAGSGGSFSAAQSSNANATAVVTYTYDFAAAAPEPSTISLFGMGLLGFSFLARKFKVRK